MKKILCSLSAFVLSSTLFCMPVLNPAEPAYVTQGLVLPCCEGLLGVKFGYRGDFVYALKLKGDNRENHRNFSLIANEGVLTINFARMIDLYGFLGAANYSLVGQKLRGHHEQRKVFVEFASSSTLITGIGLKAILWEGNIGVGGKTYLTFDYAYEYMSTAPFSYLKVNNSMVMNPGVGYKFHEGQAALTLGHKIKKLLPYFSVLWAYGRTNPGDKTTFDSGTNEIRFNTLKSYKNIGFAIGAAYLDDCRMSLTFEGRFVNEIAFTIAGNLKF